MQNKHRPQSLVYAIVGALLALSLVITLYYYSAQRGTKSINYTTPKITAATNQAVPPSLPPPTSPTPVTPPKQLLNDPLNGVDRIVTNEFTHWSPKSHCPYASATWDMTSGTLLIHNGVGYSGVPTAEKQSICNSNVNNNSATFRLNSKDFSFSNVAVAMDYMALGHGGGGAPDNSYDGIHIWVGYQNEYALYAATIFRWDSNVAIKKKVPLTQAKCSNPANDGCYYDLTKETNRKDVTTSQVWHHVAIQFGTTTTGIVTINEVIDGLQILSAQDNNAHGKSYPLGAVGVRGDNTEFYFKNFTVTKL